MEARVSGKGETRSQGQSSTSTLDIEQQLEDLLRQVKEGKSSDGLKPVKAGDDLTPDELDALLSGMLNTPTPEPPDPPDHPEPAAAASRGLAVARNAVAPAAASESADSQPNYDMVADPDSNDVDLGDELACQIQELLDEARSVPESAGVHTPMPEEDSADLAGDFEPATDLLTREGDDPMLPAGVDPELFTDPSDHAVSEPISSDTGTDEQVTEPKYTHEAVVPEDDDGLGDPWPGPLPVEAAGTENDVISATSTTSSDTGDMVTPTETSDDDSFAGGFEAPTDIAGWSEPDVDRLHGVHATADTASEASESSGWMIFAIAYQLGRPLNPIFRLLNRPLAGMAPENRDLIGYIGLLTVLVGGSLVAASIITGA